MAQASNVRSARTLSGTRVLVVEDEALIALEQNAILTDAGAQVVGPSLTLREAFNLAAREDLSAGYTGRSPRPRHDLPRRPTTSRALYPVPVLHRANRDRSDQSGMAALQDHLEASTVAHFGACNRRSVATLTSRSSPAEHRSGS